MRCLIPLLIYNHCLVVGQWWCVILKPVTKRYSKPTNGHSDSSCEKKFYLLKIYRRFSYKQKLRKLIALTNLHQYSQPLHYLWLETKEGCFKCERCQHVNATLQKISWCPGNVTLGVERILFKEALNRLETDFQKSCNTGLCTLYPQS